MTIDAMMGEAEQSVRSMARPGASPLVRVRDVSHSFDPVDPSNKVLRENTLDLYPGEIVIMTGQSGSGKTTLLTLIGGLRKLQENSGTIEVLGRQLAGMNDGDFRQHRRKIGFIFQAHNLFGSLNAIQNVRLAQELDDGRDGEPRPSDEEIDKKAIALLTRLDLASKVKLKPHQLSGGQRQRVSIARALVNSPRLILADEPTAALDAKAADIVVDLLKEIVSSGEKTTIIVTHDTKILETAHRIVNMRYGKIVSNINVPRATQICKFLQQCSQLREMIPGTLTEIDLAIANRMVEESFDQGKVIFHQGDDGEKFYMIRNGCVDGVRLKEDGTREEFKLKEGEFFGEVALLEGKKRNATLHAQTDVELFSLRKADFDDILKSRANFEQQVRDVIVRRS
jgi:putative ABC transport system ATP-binding protein